MADTDYGPLAKGSRVLGATRDWTGAGEGYGKAPEIVGEWLPGWQEYMHYLYLPVWMPGAGGFPRLPRRLAFAHSALNTVYAAEHDRRGRGWMEDHYVYVTARRGYASPGNPLNRPGWHADGFGSEDINYVWSDRFPTRYAVGDFGEISDDHVESARQFDRKANGAASHLATSTIQVYECEPNTLYRLDPFVVHSVPEIPPPGGERSFLKVSISRNRYNLAGNSHNYLFDYHWKMWTRDEVRNDPAYAGGDAGPQELAA